MHHTLFYLPGFGELGFEGGDFLVHVAEDGGDGGLFVVARGANLELLNITAI